MRDWTLLDLLPATALLYVVLCTASAGLAVAHRIRRWRDASDARRERSRIMRRIVWRQVRAMDPERAGRRN